jgi:hypothetical protein
LSSQRHIALSGMFVDLNADGQEEFVVIAAREGALYVRSNDRDWRRAGSMPTGADWPWARDHTLAIKSGAFKVREPLWRELEGSGVPFHLDPVTSWLVSDAEARRRRASSGADAPRSS